MEDLSGRGADLLARQTLSGKTQLAPNLSGNYPLARNLSAADLGNCMDYLSIPHSIPIL
jgi:hypothetical protein